MSRYQTLERFCRISYEASLRQSSALLSALCASALKFVYGFAALRCIANRYSADSKLRNWSRTLAARS